MLVEGWALMDSIFFRVGQWDLGANMAEREKSVMALREIGIFADSSVTHRCDNVVGTFSFGLPPHGAAYFTDANNFDNRAKTLADSGLLEIVPILQPQGRHPVQPTSDARTVVNAYESWLSKGRIKPGRHIIMEIEHLAE